MNELSEQELDQQLQQRSKMPNIQPFVRGAMDNFVMPAGMMGIGAGMAGVKALANIKQIPRLQIQLH